MKAIRFLERLFLVLAVVFAALAGLLAVMNTEEPYFYASLAILGGTGAMLGLTVVLLIGALLYFNKNQVVRAIGVGLTTAAMLVFVYAAIGSSGEYMETAALVALLAGVLYLISNGCRLLGAIVNRAKPSLEEGFDPESDQKIVYITKWKRLLDKGIITDEEFQAKRAAILSFDEPETEE